VVELNKGDVLPMPPQNDRPSPERVKSKIVADQPNLDQPRNPLNWIRRAILRLSIAKKIGYGYSLAIGIAVLGTTVGLISGDYYKRQAQEQLSIADKQYHLLADLENAIGAVRSHPQRLVTVLGESIWFDYEIGKFFGDVNRVKGLLSELESFTDSHPHHLAIDAPELKNLLKGYETNTTIYIQLAKSLWQQIDPPNLKREQIQAAQVQLLTFIRGKAATDVSVKFDRLSERLTQLKAAAENQQIQANQSLEQAEALRRQIIIVSMVLSVAIAATLALITSRAIARPLQAVTDVARAVTQDGNFDIQAPVTTEDEVGSLATSLNQLVQWVGEHTQELELARQTLEQRVEERTQELKAALQNLEQTQVQLIQTEKMSSLGLLVSGVAHEINNPINFIYGNLAYTNEYTQELLRLIELYQQQYPNPTAVIQNQIEDMDLDFIKVDLPKVLTSMNMGTERIRKIVLSLRNFSRLDEAEVKAVDIHEGIDNTLLILNHRLKQGIDVIKKYGDLPPVPCYPAQVNQVFMNILANAIDALLTEDSPPYKQIVIHTQTVAHNQIRVGIWNNGSGIPSEIKNKLFDPFFTTKPVGQGTGLGLSICYQIMEKHSGQIEVVSEPGQGTEFAIALPIQTKNGIFSSAESKVLLAERVVARAEERYPH
jgi:signal transduction histidine kinase